LIILSFKSKHDRRQFSSKQEFIKFILSLNNEIVKLK